MTSWKRRLARAGLAVLVVLLAGATVQGVTTAFERRRFQRTGQMVDAGGYQLHIVCAGEGRPAVILGAAAMMMSAEWGWVQRDLAAVTRVCSYDRAGLGYSEAGDAPYDPGQAVDELHRALASAHVPPPYVLAGHALGAALNRIYAGRFPAEVAGLVLIDPPASDLLSRMPPEGRERLRSATRRLAAMPWLARFGLLRVHNPLASLAAGLPDPQYGETRMFLVTPDHLARGARELSALDRTLALLQQTPKPEGIPVTVVTGGRSDGAPAAASGPAHNAHLLPGGTDQIVLTDRTQASRVAAIIRTVVEKSRTAGQASLR